MINEQIRDKEVRLISETGEQLGIVSGKEAQKLASISLIRLKKKKRPVKDKKP